MVKMVILLPTTSAVAPTRLSIKFRGHLHSPIGKWRCNSVHVGAYTPWNMACWHRFFFNPYLHDISISISISIYHASCWHQSLFTGDFSQPCSITSQPSMDGPHIQGGPLAAWEQPRSPVWPWWRKFHQETHPKMTFFVGGYVL